MTTPGATRSDDSRRAATSLGAHRVTSPGAQNCHQLIVNVRLGATSLGAEKVQSWSKASLI